MNYSDFDRLVTMQLQDAADKRPQWEKDLEYLQDCVAYMDNAIAKQYIIDLAKHVLGQSQAPAPAITKAQAQAAVQSVSTEWRSTIWGYLAQATYLEEPDTKPAPKTTMQVVTMRQGRYNQASVAVTSFGVFSID